MFAKEFLYSIDEGPTLLELFDGWRRNLMEAMKEPFF